MPAPPFLSFVAHLGLELRVPSGNAVLVEEPTQVVPGRFLDCASKIHGFDALSAIRFHIVTDGAKKQLVSKPATKLVKDQRAFLVEVAIEEIHRQVEFPGD